MAVGSKNLELLTLTSATSFTAASQQFLFVGINSSNEVVPISADTQLPIGVLQNNPARGEAAKVAYCGLTKVRVGATDIAVNARIGIDANGRAIAITAGTSTGYFVLGRVVYIDAADNDGALVAALIETSAPARNG